MAVITLVCEYDECPRDKTNTEAKSGMVMTAGVAVCGDGVGV